MSLDGFMQFMLGSESDIFNVDHSEVYQDMSQPLSAYFIASSHNTYLLEDQLKGPSSCEAYINALKRGCRCVERESTNERDSVCGQSCMGIEFKSVLVSEVSTFQW